MSEMVERLARELCAWVGEERYIEPGVADRYRVGARQLITAMREPTAEMAMAMRNSMMCVDGNLGGESGPSPELGDGEEIEGYHAAIDAALR